MVSICGFDFGLKLHVCIPERPRNRGGREEHDSNWKEFLLLVFFFLFTLSLSLRCMSGGIPLKFNTGLSCKQPLASNHLTENFSAPNILID